MSMTPAIAIHVTAALGAPFFIALVRRRKLATL